MLSLGNRPFYKAQKPFTLPLPAMSSENLNLAHYQIFGGLAVSKERIYIALYKNIFNPPNESAVYLLLLVPESDGRGSKHDPN